MRPLKFSRDQIVSQGARPPVKLSMKQQDRFRWKAFEGRPKPTRQLSGVIGFFCPLHSGPQVAAPVERFEYFDEQSDNAARRKKFPALLTLCPGELSQKVFVNSAECIVAQTGRYLGYLLQEFFQQGAMKIS